MQRCLVSANHDYTRPGDVFRRVMECVASGVFLPGEPARPPCLLQTDHCHAFLPSPHPLTAGGTGLMDPCEKGVVDASAPLSAQERANITLSAQVQAHICPVP